MAILIIEFQNGIEREKIMSNDTNISSDFVIENEMLVKYEGKERIVQIPEGVKKIGQEAFLNANIEEIIFPTSLQSIEDSAFEKCKKLNFVDITEQVIKIGDHAFYDCSALKCVYVPASIVILEENAFDRCASDFFVLGSEGTEAEKLAKAKSFGFKIGSSQDLQEFKCLNQKKENLATKSFDVFGETIICSNSLTLYDKILNRYKTVSEKFVDKIKHFLPEEFDGSLNGDMKQIIDELLEQAIGSLQLEGVVIEKNKAYLAIYSDFEKLIKNILLVEEQMLAIAKTLKENVSDKKVDLEHERNSKVTGLSYGVIGSKFDIALHDFADTMERIKQDREATSEANQAFSVYVSQQRKASNKSYKAELNKQLPEICKKAEKTVNSLMNWEFSLLSKSGFLDMQCIKQYDYQKSIEVFDSCKLGCKNETMLLALSIKKYPYNVKALSRAVFKKYESQGLVDLIEFLGVAEEVKKCAKKERKEFLLQLDSEILNDDITAKSKLELYLQEKHFLSQKEKSDFLAKIVQGNTEKILSLLALSDFFDVDDTRSYAQKLLNDIISQEDWDSLAKEGVCPVDSPAIPAEKCATYAALEEYVILTLEHTRREKDTQLDAAQRKLESSQTLADYESVRELFIALNGHMGCKSTIREIDKKILELKCAKISADLGASKKREHLLRAKNELMGIDEYEPAKEKIAEIDRLLRKDVKKKVILSIIAAILLTAVCLVYYFVIYPIVLKNSDDFSNYRIYIKEFDVTSFVIPEGVTEIPADAFKDCRSLYSITIPSSVTKIGKGAFSGCDRLVNIYITDLKAWCEIEFESSPLNGERRYAYANNNHPMLYVNGESVIDLVIPDGVTKISDHAFSGYWHLESVAIGKDVEIIGDWAFGDCDGLSRITIPDGVKSIGKNAFWDCSQLGAISLGANIESIGDLAFGARIHTVYVSNIEQWFRFNLNSEIAGEKLGNKVTAYRLYVDNEELENLVIPSGINDLGVALRGCQSLTSITIPNSVTDIGDEAFAGCSSLTSITILDGLKSIGDRAFSGCENLTSITIPDGVKSIGNYAFDECRCLTSIMIPNSVMSIGNYALDDCYRLEFVWYTGDSTDWSNISMGYKNTNSSLESGNIYYYSETQPITGRYWYYLDGVPTVWELFDLRLLENGTYEVQGIGTMKATTDLVIPSKINGRRVTSIGSLAFDGCLELTSVTIPDSVTDIGYCAFGDCKNLTSITIPNSVKSIGMSAFSGCENLVDIVIPRSVTSLGSYAFDGRDNLLRIYYGGTSKEWSAAIGYSGVGSNTRVYYYSATQPTTAGNYWHYVDDVPKAW